MLARPDTLPRGDYGFEVKWDGFQALASRPRARHETTASRTDMRHGQL
jgi:hypothetical protein